MSFPFQSNHRPGDPIHTICWLRSQNSTIPSCIDIGCSASWIINVVADEDGPRLVTDKHLATYFLATDLLRAPYVGKTASRFPPGAEGQMRSAAHVIAGSWLAIDCDGLEKAIWKAILDRLKASGIKYCAYSTWSHGLPTKEGIRVRILLFLDRALAPQDWTRAWYVINQHFFSGLADQNTKFLHQQAAAWATGPDRAHLAFRHVGGKFLLSADSLLAASSAIEKEKPPATRWEWAPGTDRPKQVERARRALEMLDASSYHGWLKGLAGLKGMVAQAHLSEKTACKLWLCWSASAFPEAQDQNQENRYNPETMWHGWSPSMAPAQALVGAFFAAARDSARGEFVSDLKQGQMSSRGLLAARYLAEFHHQLFTTLRTANGSCNL